MRNEFISHRKELIFSFFFSSSPRYSCRSSRVLKSIAMSERMGNHVSFLRFKFFIHILLLSFFLQNQPSLSVSNNSIQRQFILEHHLSDITANIHLVSYFTRHLRQYNFNVFGFNHGDYASFCIFLNADLAVPTWNIISVITYSSSQLLYSAYSQV